MKEQEYIYAVYREKSFSGAAKKLFLSQPALSLAVRKVEDELGISIFDRSTVPLSLTEEGKIYISALESIRAVEQSLNDRLSDMTELKTGHLTVSGENFVSSFILPDVLMKYSERYAGIKVDIVESNSPDLMNLLLSEEIDLLIAHDFDSGKFTSVDLFEERILLAVPESFEVNARVRDYALSAKEVKNGLNLKKEPVSLSAFAKEPFLFLKPGNNMCRRAEELCAEAGFEPSVGIRLDQLITSYNLSSAGMGIAFVTDALVSRANVTNCVYYALSGKSAIRKMSIGYRKNRYLSRAAAAFIDTAKEIFSSRDLPFRSDRDIIISNS